MIFNLKWFVLICHASPLSFSQAQKQIGGRFGRPRVFGCPIFSTACLNEMQLQKYMKIYHPKNESSLPTNIFQGHRLAFNAVCLGYLQRSSSHVAPDCWSKCHFRRECTFYTEFRATTGHHSMFLFGNHIHDSWDEEDDGADEDVCLTPWFSMP